MKRALLTMALGLAVFASVPAGAASFEKIDQDQDGRFETKLFMNGQLKVRSEADLDNDGRADEWRFYGPKGTLKRILKDTNGDGRPDDMKELLRGRNIVLREQDRNFDGRVDTRKLTTWEPSRNIPGQPEIPGYLPVWKEEDQDYDGTVDLYTERGNDNPPQDRIGQQIGRPVESWSDTTDLFNQPKKT